MIKILKPGIEDFLVADLNFIYVVARIFEFLSPEFSRTSLVCSQVAVENPFSSVLIYSCCPIGRLVLSRTFVSQCWKK